jgi:3-methyl-2-oxobutanoate hydroxymethyltransferase
MPSVPEELRKVTVPAVRSARDAGRRIVMLTAYDAPTARLLDEAGVDILLVGDSVGNNVLGYDSTLPVTMDDMLHHTRAVVRGARRALVVADMPYLSYHTGRRDAVRNAGRFIKDAGAAAVKIEGGRRRAGLVCALLDAEIPVMGHVGLTPQSVHVMGGYRVQGKRLDEARALIEDALESRLSHRSGAGRSTGVTSGESHHRQRALHFRSGVRFAACPGRRARPPAC